MQRVLRAACLVGVLTLTGCTGWAVAWPTLASGPSSPATTATPAQERVRVTFVGDGDTFAATRADGERIRVRLLGIDAPEAATEDQPAQCGAGQATQALTRLIGGRRVALVGDPSADRFDRFGRRLAYVEVNGTDVGAALVADGLAAAWYPSGEPQPERFPTYQDAEDAARAAGTGLWATCGTIGR